MDSMEHNISKDDAAAETTRLQPRREMRQNVAQGTTRMRGKMSGIPYIRQLLFAGGALICILTIILVYVVFLYTQTRNPSSYIRSHFVLPTVTPIISPWGSGQNIDVTIVNGVTYVGAADGVVSALRASDGTVLWHYTTQGSADEQPLVVNGVVYVSTDLDTGVGSVYALRANDGTLLWRYTSADHLVYQPTVVGEVAYVGSRDGTVIAMRASNGSPLWHYKVTSPIDRPVVFSGIVYVVSERKTLFALKASNGSLIYAMNGAFLGSPVIVDNRAYVSSDNGTESAFQPGTGSLLWHYTHDGIALQPPLVINGIVYVVATQFPPDTSQAPVVSSALWINGSTFLFQKQQPSIHPLSSVYALRASDGSLLWKYNGNMVHGWAWVAATNNVVYVSTSISQSKGYILALQGNDGALLWSYAIDDSPFNAAAIANGMVYIGAINGNVYTLRASSGSLLWRYTILGALLNTPIPDDETVYIGSANGIVYAFQTTNGSLLWHYLTPANGN